MDNCRVCKEPAGHICDECERVAYCGEECQIIDWKHGNHANTCMDVFSKIQAHLDHPEAELDPDERQLGHMIIEFEDKEEAHEWIEANATEHIGNYFKDKKTKKEINALKSDNTKLDAKRSDNERKIQEKEGSLKRKEKGWFGRKKKTKEEERAYTNQKEKTKSKRKGFFKKLFGKKDK